MQQKINHNEERNQFTRGLMHLVVDDRYKLARHLILAVGILFMIACSDTAWKSPGIYAYYKLASIFITLMMMCYVNMVILVPLFFFKGRYLSYLVLLVIIVVSCLSLLSLLTAEIDLHAIGELRSRLLMQQISFYHGTITLIPIILVTTMIMLLQRWVRDRESLIDLQNVTLKMELEGLRNQINPHFLFNTLNGIKALIRNEPQKAVIVITKLSEFLRYQLYEHDGEKIMLTSEVNFISNFLALEQLRRDNLHVEVNLTNGTASTNGIFLPPNLFTIFVENAVKHGVNVDGEAAYIKVNLHLERDKLIFTSLNSVDPRFRVRDKKNSGLGLANIQRRLELLYPGTHRLNIQSGPNEYKVELEIKL